MHGIKDSTKQVELLEAATRTSDANGDGQDLGNGAQYVLVLLSVGTFDTADGDETLDVKLQDSEDNSTWADVADGAFTQVVAGDQFEAIEVGAVRRHVRAVATFGGTTPSADCAVVAVASGLPVRGDVTGI